MPINPDLLIAAAILQDGFVEKDGTPMSAGVITCYRDNSRTTLKNWYYQSSNFADASGNYTFSPLPNPLTLSAAGTICDINGVDTIPFFYPYDENDQTQPQPYYITIVNYAQTNQITRPNFPYNPQEEDNTGEGSVDNFIINNVFWRNAGTVNLQAVTQQVVCPSQHDGFQFPDIQFIKNNTNGQDTLTFTKFPLSSQPILTGDITPEYYINHTCSNAPTGETQKMYQFPISLHVNTLNAVQFTCTIQAQNVGGTAPGENTINLFIFQDTGTGTATIPPSLIGSITLNPAWTKYEFTNVFPNTGGITLSQVGNDALYLQVQMPLNINCSINFTKPSIYLIDTAPTNSFQTYDQIDPIINGFRTGDIRTSLNSFAPYGWVPANDGTIGSASSGATTRANVDTWPLYELIWGAVSDTYAPVSGGRGVSAYADFIANKPMALTKTLSRFIGEAGAGAGLTSYALGQTAGAESSSVTLLAANLPPHTHDYTHITNSGIGGFGLAAGTLGTFPTYQTGVGPGTSTPFNVATIPPSVFYNMFFKL
jgi:hypothetical protein